jgi:signal transduction histidine kinase
MPPVNIYSAKQRWKLLLLFASLFIGAGSLWYTNNLVSDLSHEEKKKVHLWAQATQRIFESTPEQHELNFLFQVLENNTTIPAILTDENYHILFYRNIDSLKAIKPAYLLNLLNKMKRENPPIEIIIEGNKKNYCFYTDSLILKRLTIYPYVQLFIIIVFVIVSYFAFSASRRAEQNKVWVGLSRETAHQLGTPTSSLMAWIELLKEKDEHNELIIELDKDVKRLEIITERFSNIGSQPLLIHSNILPVIENVVGYMKNRIPGTVQLIFEKNEGDLYVPFNSNLFAWVIENIIKNAIDATGTNGVIRIIVESGRSVVNIDITDNGKGIARKDVKRVFKPGFTTKSRGWGLGLSLARRIIEEYHQGRIFVLRSEIGKGTTFRIVLPLKNSKA